MVKFSLCLAFVFAAFHFANGQDGDRETVTQSIQWAAVTSSVKVSKRLSILVDGQFRQAGQLEPMQYQARTGLDIKVNDHFSIVPMGYVYTWNFQYGKQPTAIVNNEHRTWQQVMYKHDAGIVHFEHRLRLEQRFLQHHSVTSNGDVVDDGYSVLQHRLRYRLQARIPLNNRTIDPKTYYAIIYDEIFKSWGENITFDSPDQNRVFAGVGYQFEKNFSMHMGGIYQMVIKRNGAQQENNLGVLLQLTYNIDLMKN
ncbi:MAG TPA: DUF2490 domain-containing protein [Chryseolinea sp.]|nr:DUF2490 domain-containing protein [Chryseolinea sp.]